MTVSAADIDAGSTVEADFGDAVGDGTVTVDGLSVETVSAVDSLTVDARSVDAADLPEGTPALGGDAASYVEFETSAASEDIAGATVSFTADADALGAAPDDVRPFRLVDGEWTALETTHESDGVYTAETPGFSYFAVSGATDDANAGNSDSSAGDGSAGSSDSGDDSEAGDEDGGDASGPGTDDGSGGGGGAPVLEEQTPGFGVLTALLAAIGAALLARRY